MIHFHTLEPNPVWNYNEVVYNMEANTDKWEVSVLSATGSQVYSKIMAMKW